MKEIIMCGLDITRPLPPTHLLYDISAGKVNHANLAGHVHHVVLCDIESWRSQPIPVQDGSHIPSVTECQKG